MVVYLYTYTIYNQSVQTEGPSGEGYNLTAQILSDLENVKVSLDSLHNLQVHVYIYYNILML